MQNKMLGRVSAAFAPKPIKRNADGSSSARRMVSVFITISSCRISVTLRHPLEEPLSSSLAHSTIFRPTYIWCDLDYDWANGSCTLSRIIYIGFDPTAGAAVCSRRGHRCIYEWVVVNRCNWVFSDLPPTHFSELFSRTLEHLFEVPPSWGPS